MAPLPARQLRLHRASSGDGLSPRRVLDKVSRRLRQESILDPMGCSRFTVTPKPLRSDSVDAARTRETIRRDVAGTRRIAPYCRRCCD
jgi:hypothetical protein